jgi:hypothetical protein
MNGLEISRRFFAQWGLQWLRAAYPELVKRIAAGRTSGSDVIGADDEWSRDHDWGPCFRIWLRQDDYRRFGRRLRREINEAAPREFEGATYHFFGKPKDNVKVESIDGFFRDEVGRATPPQNPLSWFVRREGDPLVDRESWLYFIRHGEVFHDPLGEFTARREAFARYPRDVRLKLMERQCTTLWYVTDYKLRWRLVHRADPYPLHSAVTQSVEAAMKLCFYLNDDYAPHWQWLHHEFLKLPEAETLGSALDRFLAGKTGQECLDVQPNIINYLTNRLAEDGWIEPGHSDMMKKKDEIKAKIADPTIRERIH